MWKISNPQTFTKFSCGSALNEVLDKGWWGQDTQRKGPALRGSTRGESRDLPTWLTLDPRPLKPRWGCGRNAPAPSKEMNEHSLTQQHGAHHIRPGGAER